MEEKKSIAQKNFLFACFSEPPYIFPATFEAKESSITSISQALFVFLKLRHPFLFYFERRGGERGRERTATRRRRLFSSPCCGAPVHSDTTHCCYCLHLLLVCFRTIGDKDIYQDEAVGPLCEHTVVIVFLDDAVSDSLAHADAGRLLLLFLLLLPRG